MPNHRKPTGICQICKIEKSQRDLLPAELVRPALVRLIEMDHPGWQSSGFFCLPDLNRFRLKQQWTRFVEIQEIQLELMQELADRKR